MPTPSSFIYYTRLSSNSLFSLNVHYSQKFLTPSYLPSLPQHHVLLPTLQHREKDVLRRVKPFSMRPSSSTSSKVQPQMAWTTFSSWTAHRTWIWSCCVQRSSPLPFSLPWTPETGPSLPRLWGRVIHLHLPCLVVPAPCTRPSTLSRRSHLSMINIRPGSFDNFSTETKV